MSNGNGNAPPVLAVIEFAVSMQRKLDLNHDKACSVMNPDGKGRKWLDCDFRWLLRRLRMEAMELEVVLECNNYADSPQVPEAHQLQKIMDEAADVGNFAMMIYDNAKHALEKGEPSERQR